MTSLHSGSSGIAGTTTSEPKTTQSTMATRLTLPPPPALEIHEGNVAEKWKKFHFAWSNNALASAKQKVRASTGGYTADSHWRGRKKCLLYFRLDDETNKNKIEPALPQFANYCQPRKNIPFDHYHFNKQAKEAGKSYDQYKTALRQLPKGCEFTTITPEEILRGRLIFGIIMQKYGKDCCENLSLH